MPVFEGNALPVCFRRLLVSLCVCLLMCVILCDFTSCVARQSTSSSSPVSATNHPATNSSPRGKNVEPTASVCPLCCPTVCRVLWRWKFCDSQTVCWHAYHLYFFFSPGFSPGRCFAVIVLKVRCVQDFQIFSNQPVHEFRNFIG